MVKVNINLGEIEFNDQKYLESYKILDNLIKLIDIKFEEKEDIDFEWPNEVLNLKINKIKMQSLIKYLENKIEENEFINLDEYLKLLIDIIEKTKDKIENIEEIENKLSSLQIEYSKKKILNLMDQKDYQESIKLCNEFLQNFPSNNYIKREIKQIKLECLQIISDNFIKENKKEEFMQLIKEISVLKQEIDSELGINQSSEDLIDIMCKVMNEKAEYFNRNNLHFISENISDLGLQIDPNNIDLLTEKSISNYKKGSYYINKAIDSNDKILSIESENFSAKLNKINNISKLCLKDLNKKYINYLIEFIKTSKLIDGNYTILVERSIEVLTILIKKYDIQIYDLFKDNQGNNIFPKLKLIEFSFQNKQLQYISSELLKTFYSSFEGKELITDSYEVANKKIFGFFDLGFFLPEKELKKEDLYILEIMEKIILDNNILLEIRVNILFLFSKMDPYFIGLSNCYIIPINFIEFLFKFRDDYIEFIDISLQVLLSLINAKYIELNDSLKESLLKYIEKNINNNNLMIDRTDIDEYLRKNKYDESKLEFTFENIKQNFKKKGCNNYGHY